MIIITIIIIIIIIIIINKLSKSSCLQHTSKEGRGSIGRLQRTSDQLAEDNSSNSSSSLSLEASEKTKIDYCSTVILTATLILCS